MDQIPSRQALGQGDEESIGWTAETGQILL